MRVCSSLYPFSSCATATASQKMGGKGGVAKDLINLRLRLRTQNLQAQCYANQIREAKIDIATCANEGDKIALQDAIQRRNRAEALYKREFEQMRALQDIIQALEDAVRNLEMAQHLEAANLSLKDVLASMPEEKVIAIMDGLRDSMDDMERIDTLLAEPLKEKEEEQDINLDLLDSLTVPLAKSQNETDSKRDIRHRVPS